MFPDSFWFNFAVFLLAQGVAYGFLRTGLVLRGTALMVSSWVAVDVALVARFAFGDTGAVYFWSLVLLQAHTLVEALRLVVGRIRHFSPQRAEQREEEFRAAFRAYLRNRLEVAESAYRKLARRDPWDLESALGWGTVLCRRGYYRQAKGVLLRARWLDRDRRFRDVIEAEVARCRARSAVVDAGEA